MPVNRGVEIIHRPRKDLIANFESHLISPQCTVSKNVELCGPLCRCVCPVRTFVLPVSIAWELIRLAS